MPEFEDNKPQANLDKNAHQYQPSQGKSDQNSPQANAQTGQPSNLRGRWKRSPRGPKPTFVEKEPQPESIQDINEPTSIEYEEELIHEEEPPMTREERAPKPQLHKAQASSTKPISRKDVFIPKTKQESERHKTRYPAMGRKKASLWQRILAFFGLGTMSTKSARKYKEGYDHKKSSRSHSGSYQKKKYSPSKKHTGQRTTSHKHPEKKGPKSSF